jgi:hypothetical protein
MVKQDVILKYNRSSVHISLLRIATNQASTSNANGQCKRIEAACAGSFVSCQSGVVTVGLFKLKVMQEQCRFRRGHRGRLFGCVAVTTVYGIASA